LYSKFHPDREHYRGKAEQLYDLVKESCQYMEEPYADHFKKKAQTIFENSISSTQISGYEVARTVKTKVYDKASVGYLILDRFGRIIDYNRKIADLWCADSLLLRGRSVYSLLHPDHGLHFNQIIEKAKILAQEQTFEICCRRRDGRDFVARGKASVAHASLENDLVMLVSFEEISRQQTLAAVVQALTDEAALNDWTDFARSLGEIMVATPEVEAIVFALREQGSAGRYRLCYVDSGRRAQVFNLDYSGAISLQNLDETNTLEIQRRLTDFMLRHAIADDSGRMIKDHLHQFIWGPGNDCVYGHISLFFADEASFLDDYCRLIRLVGQRFERDIARCVSEKHRQQAIASRSMVSDRQTADLQRKACRLEQEIEARKVIEGKLIQLKERAEQSSRSKSLFLANVSHEIRTPLNGIMGVVSILDTFEGSPEYREYVRMLHDSGQDLIAIIDNLLDLSSLEAGSLELAAGDFNLRDMLLEVYRKYRPQAEEKGIQLIMSLPFNQPVKIHGDERRIQQILGHLLSNAIKFTEEGFVSVKVKIKQATGEQTFLKVSVTDSGPGMGDGHSDRIWQNFECLDSSTTRKTDGFGLGLAITDKLLRVMKGRICLRTSPGQGSRFDFLVPVGITRLKSRNTYRSGQVGLMIHRGALREHVAACLASLNQKVTLIHDAGQLEAQSPETTIVADTDHLSDMKLLATTSRKKDTLNQQRLILVGESSVRLADLGEHVRKLDGMMLLKGVESLLSLYCDLVANRRGCADGAPDGPLPVLLAEDNEINQRVSADMLRLLGVRVEVVKNGREAVKSVTENDYAIVLMDCFMPEMDGVEAMKRIKTLTQPSPPVIAVTANAVKSERQRYLNEGFDGFLAKPFQLHDLQTILFEFVQVPRLPGSASM
jgi:signal transduction histidine kinase/PAS domain-containing protein